MGIGAVAVYSDADRHSLHVRQADEAVHIGAAAATDSYLNTERILAAARDSSAPAIHPGYGFLSENAGFAQACAAAGIVFIGPTPDQLRSFGLKHTARQIAEDCGVPLLPGSRLVDTLEAAIAAAREVGFPLMLKSTAGGGGIGMQLCRDEPALREAFTAVRRLSQSNFSDSGVFLEKFIVRARHIEVQIFGDGHGQVYALGERDCSLQRRNQKVVEETPAPHLPAGQRAAMLATAQRLGRAVNYRSAGTVEFIYDLDAEAFYFLEVNTRLQVEHGVTEAVTGLDLVEWMIRTAAGEPINAASFDRLARGHAIQARIYAEDPGKQFQPSTGLLTATEFPDNVRVETWVERGTEISPYYDPMLAKMIVAAPDRASAISALAAALDTTRLDGIETNLQYLREIVTDPVLAAGAQTTSWLNDFQYRARGIDVIDAGTQTTVQDWPGRIGYWNIGVPPSGPMDSLAFRIGNRLLGNPEGAAGLELTISGPTLVFSCDAVIALTGATMTGDLDGQPLPFWRAVPVKAGATLTIGSLSDAGARTYLLVRGGIDVPEYLGSRATFTLGRFGGHGGRALRSGDVLRPGDLECGTPASLPPASIPQYGHHWELHAIYGPHGAPDFFTPADIDSFFATDWGVHYNSSRTGVRLIGPKPVWARADGGEAGLHPSNIHDNAYAIGSVDFTGDMPVILGPDGPSLGGFVCPATVISADLWKLGQLQAGDTVRFVAVGTSDANDIALAHETGIARMAPARPRPQPVQPVSAILETQSGDNHPVGVSYRIAGDQYLLVEYGEMVLDLNLRFRVQALLEWLTDCGAEGLLELTPGVRSLQIHYAPTVLSLSALMTLLRKAEQELAELSTATIPSRIVHLPLAWNDSQTRLATSKYMQSVRADAPWCPDNIEFIRRINGLNSEADVKQIVFDASYLVMGLGDVYLSAPLATPLDPRHRLVTTKYNPARTWTPENAVGIGGSYMCIYGMEGPGGYQFVGRTLQIWNRYKATPEFEQPWLLRFFDQIRFFEVSESELLEMREDFPHGGVPLRIEHTEFSLPAYNDFLEKNATEIRAFKSRQQAAFDAERRRWVASGQANYAPIDAPQQESGEVRLADGEHPVAAQVQGVVWQICVEVGDTVEAGDALLILEFMKTEVAVTAARSGTVTRVLCSSGVQVEPGRTLLAMTYAQGNPWHANHRHGRSGSNERIGNTSTGKRH